MDCPDYRVRSVLHRRLRSGGVVYGLGTEARIRAVRDLPHYHRRIGSGVCVEADGVAFGDSTTALTRYLPIVVAASS
jgi:hypothetical protein